MYDFVAWAIENWTLALSWYIACGLAYAGLIWLLVDYTKTKRVDDLFTFVFWPLNLMGFTASIIRAIFQGLFGRSKR